MHTFSGNTQTGNYLKMFDSCMYGNGIENRIKNHFRNRVIIIVKEKN